MPKLNQIIAAPESTRIQVQVQVKAEDVLRATAAEATGQHPARGEVSYGRLGDAVFGCLFR